MCIPPDMMMGNRFRKMLAARVTPSPKLGSCGPHIAAGDELAHAVSNLVDNAARYAASLVRITLPCYEDTARIIVDDDGPGIPLADRERVFQRFTRLDDSRAGPQGGSGLGLAVVRAIISRHHGQIRIDDSPLGGARFVAEFPAGPIALSSSER
jgi:two-component system OmpR family sensor kinase